MRPAFHLVHLPFPTAIHSWALQCAPHPPRCVPLRPTASRVFLVPRRAYPGSYLVLPLPILFIPIPPSPANASRYTPRIPLCAPCSPPASGPVPPVPPVVRNQSTAMGIPLPMLNRVHPGFPAVHDLCPTMYLPSPQSCTFCPALSTPRAPPWVPHDPTQPYTTFIHPLAHSVPYCDPCVPCPPPPHPVPLAPVINRDSPPPPPQAGLLPNTFGRGGKGRALLSLGGYPGKIRELISGSPAATHSFLSVFLKAFPPRVSSDDVRKS